MTEIVNFMVIFSKPLRGSRSTSRRKHHLRISVLNVFELSIYVLNMVRRDKIRQWRTVLITFLQKCLNMSIIIFLWNCYTKDKDEMTTDTVTSFTPIFFLTIPLYLSLLPNSLSLTGSERDNYSLPADLVVSIYFWYYVLSVTRIYNEKVE